MGGSKGILQEMIIAGFSIAFSKVPERRMYFDLNSCMYNMFCPVKAVSESLAEGPVQVGPFIRRMTLAPLIINYVSHDVFRD
jgi:hypothetical protein